MVGEPGEISVRGGILDVFPPGAERPVRLELEGDTIDSIRAFDPETQRSIGPVDVVEILPVVEAPIGAGERERLAIAASLWRDRLPNTAEARSWLDRLGRLEAGEYVPGVEALVRIFQNGTTDLTTWGRGALRVVDDPGSTSGGV